jgi:hypothetical protein
MSSTIAIKSDLHHAAFTEVHPADCRNVEGGALWAIVAAAAAVIMLAGDCAQSCGHYYGTVKK